MRLLKVRAFLVLAAGSMAAASLPLAAQQASADRFGLLTPAMLGQETPAATPAAAAAAQPAAGPAIPAKTVQFLNDTSIGGYLSASYFYNFNTPASKVSTGRSFDQKSDEFALNKLKLTLDNPVEYSGDKWDAGFHTDLVFGEDAPLIQSSGLSLGNQGDLESANFTVNAPIGNGIQFSFGKWATLMGVEVIEETVNPNWSEGNQFLFVENFTHLGAQVGYSWNKYIETKVRITNGWDVVKDNNHAKSYMGQIIITPHFVEGDDTAFYIVPYGGPEQVHAGAWRSGINFVASRSMTKEFKVSLQLDYGHEDKSAALADPTTDAQWYAAGIWLTYDIAEYVDHNPIVLALRLDYLNDPDGARTSGAPFTAPFPLNTGQELESLTFTVNYNPLPNVQVRPEIRWDHSDHNVFEGDDDQVTAGVGVAYLF